MSLPPNCKRITRGERTALSERATSATSDDAFFAVYNDLFLDIVGSNPSIIAAVEAGYPAFHEAGVYIPAQDAVFITSNRHKPKGSNDQTINISKITRMTDGAKETWKWDELETRISMGNGGINYGNDVLFCAQGSTQEHGGLVVMKPKPPYQTNSLLDNYFGRLFNSVNDVVVHTDGSIWFTDPIYGYEQGFRNKPQLPCQVYRFDPISGDVRAVADGFGRPNGICFSTDEQTVYITDTDWIHGDGTTDLARVSSIYAFDLIKRHGSHFLANRRLFAMADTGIPDGIKCDLEGNVYSGCGDSVSVWNAGGVLLGKIMVPGGAANFCFGRKGEMFILNEKKFWVAKFSEAVQGALLHNMSIAV